MNPIRIPLAPIAAIVGVALIGNGVDGSVGAGIGLVGCVVAGFLVALIGAQFEVARVERARRRKSLRHRWFLAVDRYHRRRERKKRGREERRRAERNYLRRRDRKADL
jgi:hypothetical protein